MRILCPSDYRVMPWKNGGGSTTEIMIWPEGASVAGGFDWRISMADVASDGPFSRFEGYERKLLVLSGAGIRLSSSAWDLVELCSDDVEPFGFMGNDDVAGMLIDGPIRDFNVISRRNDQRHVHAWLRRCNAEPIKGPTLTADFDLFHVLTGALIANGVQVTAGETVVFTSGEAMNVTPQPKAEVVCTTIWDD